MTHTALRSATAAWILTIPVAFITYSATAHATPTVRASAAGTFGRVLPQGDAASMIQQGHEALRRGDDAAALEKFRAAIASNPSNDEAWRIYKETDQAVWLRMLAKGGEYDQIARAFLAKATPGMGAYKKDAAAIEPLIADATGDDFGKRIQANAKLAGQHGPYAVQYLVGALGDAGNDDRRIRAMESAVQIGGSAVPPLVALLQNSDPTIRRSAIVALARLGDIRAKGRLAHLAESDGDNLVRAEAARAAEKMGAAAGSAVDALNAEALNYLRLHQEFVRPIDANTVVWDLVDGKLVDNAIPRALFGTEMARRAATSGTAAKAENAESVALLAMAHAEARVLAKSLPEDTGKVMAEKMPAINESLRLCGTAALMRGLEVAIELGDSRLACELIKELSDNAVHGDGATAAALVAAGMKSTNREVRISSAAAAASIDHHIAGRDDVAGLLGDGVGERVQRIAVVIDEDAGRRAALEAAFTGARWYVASCDTGITGLARIRRFAGCDVILISSSLKDIVAEQLIDDLRADDRTKTVPIVAIAGEKDVEGAKTRFGDKVKNVVAKFDGAAMDAAIEGAPMNPERMRAEELAALCATSIAHGPEVPSAVRGAVLAALADAAGGRADSVRIPAIHALGRFGGDAEQNVLAGVLGDGGASNAAKSAAGMALAAMGSRGMILNEGVFTALTKGLTGDADAGVRAACASALGRAKNMDAATRAKSLQAKQTAFTAGGAPAAN